MRPSLSQKGNDERIVQDRDALGATSIRHNSVQPDAHRHGGQFGNGNSISAAEVVMSERFMLSNGDSSPVTAKQAIWGSVNVNGINTHYHACTSHRHIALWHLAQLLKSDVGIEAAKVIFELYSKPSPGWSPVNNGIACKLPVLTVATVRFGWKSSQPTRMQIELAGVT